MRKRFWQWLEKGLTGVIGILGTVMITALVRGESLDGLGAFWQALKSRSIPVWLFAATLLAAFWGIQGTWATRERKKVLYVVWHEKNSAWHLGTSRGEPAMQIMAMATFTGCEADSIQIISAGVEGASTEMDLITPIICPRSVAVREQVVFFVKPPLAKEGKPWKGSIILIDQFNRKHVSPKLTLENRQC